MWDWTQHAGMYIFAWMAGVLAAMGFGGGAGFIKLFKNMRPPKLHSKVVGTLFDTIQDMLSNDRMGERLNEEGQLVQVPWIKKPAPVASPAPVAMVKVNG